MIVLALVLFAMVLAATAWAVRTNGPVVLWMFASLVGLVSAVERFMRGIGFSGFSFLSLQFLLGLCLLALAGDVPVPARVPGRVPARRSANRARAS